MGDKDEIWLVRSGSRILGPLSSDKVKEGLRTRDILPHDEIAGPFARWRFIMYEPVFQKAINEINRPTSGEMTGSTSVPTASAERTVSDVSKVSTVADKSQSPEMVTDVYVEEEIPAQGGRQQTQTNADYEFILESSVKNQVLRQRQSFWRIAIILCLLLVGGVAYYKHVQRSATDRAFFDELLRKAILAKLQGAYAEAITLFRDVANREQENLEMYYHYGPLLITHEKQNLLGRRMLERILQLDPNGHYFTAAQTGIGWAALLEGDPEAALQHFAQAKARDPEFYPAAYGEGVVEYQRKSFPAAIKKFREAQRFASPQSPWPDNSAHLMESLAAYRQWSREKKLEPVQGALERLEAYLITHQSQLQEELLMKAWLEFLLDQKENVRKTLAWMLNTVPGLSQHIVRDPLILREHLKWPALVDYCSALTEKLGEEAEILAVKAMCFAQAGRSIEATKTIERAVDLQVGEGKNGVVSVVHAYILYLMGKKGEARGALRNVDESAVPILANYVAGQICFEEGDFRCAEKHFSQLLATPQAQLIAVARLVEIKMELGEKVEAQNLLAKTYEQGRQFGPLLKLRHNLGGG